MDISVDIFKLCRLCQANVGIWNISENGLIEKISRCTKLQLRNDGLQSLKICSDCKDTIDSFYKYLQIIYRVDIELKQKIEHKSVQPDTSETHNKENNNLQSPHKYYQHSMVSQKHTNVNSEKRSSKNDINNMLLTKEELGKNTICEVQHRSALDNGSIKSYICKWKNCGKMCSSAYTLKTHHMRHENKKPFLCITCGKSFITKNSLSCHEKTHLDIKAYNCQLCNISFSVKSNLRAHEKKYHEGLRFYCTKCTKAYGSKASLERHERVHTGIKDYCCTSCLSAFYTKKELNKHQVYHQGLRQHKCNQCFKTFFERHHLKVHLRVHTGERPYNCSVAGCEKTFTESQKLRRHLKTKHVHS